MKYLRKQLILRAKAVGSLVRTHVTVFEHTLLKRNVGAFVADDRGCFEFAELHVCCKENAVHGDRR